MRKIRKILFVGHSIASPFMPAIISNLQRLGHQVLFFDQFRPNSVTKVIGTVKNLLSLDAPIIETKLNNYINSLLFQQVKKTQPDLVFLFKGKNISLYTIKRIRSNGHTVINWYPDYYDDWLWIKDNAPSYNYFFTPCLYVQKKLKEIGILSYYIPFAAHADEQFVSRPKIYNATFVGRFTKRREKLFKSLLETRLLDIWGYRHWKNTIYRSVYHDQVPPEKCIKIIRMSKIALNTLTATDDVPIESVNYRMFEATGVGGFVLTWYNYPLEEFFKLGQEVEIFKTAAEALEKTKFYLKNERLREKIARAGWQRTKKDHTYKVRLKQLLACIK